jgi:hypothetical protein
MYDWKTELDLIFPETALSPTNKTLHTPRRNLRDLRQRLLRKEALMFQN